MLALLQRPFANIAVHGTFDAGDPVAAVLGALPQEAAGKAPVWIRCGCASATAVLQVLANPSVVFEAAESVPEGWDVEVKATPFMQPPTIRAPRARSTPSTPASTA